MGKSGSYSGIRPAGFKSAGWVNSGRDWDTENERPIGGVCMGCRQYDVELVDNYCRDPDCKRERQEVAIAQGRAVKVVEGLPEGKSIVKTAKGNVVVKGSK